jgi:Delta7-sterol 5-desaturase
MNARILLWALGAALALANPTRAEPQPTIFGTWLTQGASAIVRVAPCGDAQACGTIAWLWEPLDERGRPRTDAENSDPKRRLQPLIGATILGGFSQAPSGAWTAGTIYNPEDGRTYTATLRLDGADGLAVEGCVLFICKKQLWRRTSAVCPSG